MANSNRLPGSQEHQDSIRWTGDRATNREARGERRRFNSRRVTVTLVILN